MKMRKAHLGLTLKIGMEERSRQTCLLLTSNGTFDSFGYDAEKRYGELSAQKLHSEYFFFRNFKMQLFGKAGMNKDQLIIALEPEVASIYCRHLPVEASENKNERWISKFPVGSKYMILDAGGGTIDITVHETEDWLYMSLQFETKKREIEIDSPRYITLRLPFSLIELCNRYRGMGIRDAVDTTRYAELVEIVRDKLKLSKVIFFYMFGPTIQKTVDHVKSLFRETSFQEIDRILMVGGFSESRLLQQALKEALPNKQIVIPSNPSSCVLRGTLIYGHFPMVINSRVLKYTYGVKKCRAFKEGYHREEKKINTDAGLRCNDIFDIFCSKNTVVKSGETYFKQTFLTVNKYQKAMSFSVFISEKRKPTYVDEDGCLKIGEIRLCLDDPDENLGRKTTLSMAFGYTEINVEAEDERTGNKIKAVIDFLG